MQRLRTSFVVTTVGALATLVFAEKPESVNTVEKGGQALTGDPIEQDPKFAAVALRFKTDFGQTVKVARANDPLVATTYVVTPMKSEHLANGLQILTWVEAELKRYPAGFLQKHSPGNLVLANAYISRAAKVTAPPYSPTFIAEKSSDSILVTVPGTMTPGVEVLGRGYIHQTLSAKLLEDVKSPDSPLALERWKLLASDVSTLETETARRLTTTSNSREGLYKMLWDPWDFAELNTLAKTDPKLKQRMEVMQSHLQSLDPQFDEALWAVLATVPESQRTVCLNDLTDTHSVDKIRADPEIQSDIRRLEKQWGFKVLWEPGSPAPSMPLKVRLEYSYFTDRKLPEFKSFIRMVREELEIYPREITAKLNVKNLIILNDFNFRGAGVAGQGFSWLPQAAFAYGVRTFDPAKTASVDFFRRTIHHEVLHLIDTEFSREGGLIHGSNWDKLNGEEFVYRVTLMNSNATNLLRFYKDNSTRPGFAEPYGMNVATDDRATLYARLMTARVADEGRGDQAFLGKLETDKILKAKADRLFEFFQFLKGDLAIAEPSPFYSKLKEGLSAVK